MTYGTDTAIRAAHNQELVQHMANPGYGDHQDLEAPRPRPRPEWDVPDGGYVLMTVAYAEGYGAIRYTNIHEATSDAQQVSMHQDVLSVALFTSDDLGAPVAILDKGRLIA